MMGPHGGARLTADVAPNRPTIRDKAMSSGDLILTHRFLHECTDLSLLGRGQRL
jgi:hypothetical protein